jgi:urea transport system ATP-binding protein
VDSDAPFLRVEALAKDFGGIAALDGLDLQLGEGELLAIIGPNGCGKTTFFNLLTGSFAPSAGRIVFDGHDLIGRRPFEIARLGIGRKFQVPGVYHSLSVAENLAVPLHARRGRQRPLDLIRPPGRDREAAGESARLLELVGLADKRDRPAGTLAHGEKQWLEIGMLLASRPQLMLLDEPTAGMTMAETRATADLIARIRAEQPPGRALSLIVIEHDIAFIEMLDCPVAVMMKGQILCRGSFAEVRSDPVVRQAYLGRRA